VRTLVTTPLKATAALILLASPPACAPGPRSGSPQPDRFDSNGDITRQHDSEVHPAIVVAAVALAAAGTLAGDRCN
jgi:hypothetical protein